MKKVSLKKEKIVSTDQNGKDFDAKNREVPKFHVISSGGKTLKGVSISELDSKKVSGVVTILDNGVPVITIDKVKLTTSIAALVAASDKDGIKKLYEIDEVSIPIRYTQKGVLSVEGNYSDLIFYFS